MKAPSYSLLDHGETKSGSGYAVGQFYEMALKPTAIMGSVGWLLYIIQNDFKSRFARTAAGDPMELFHALLIALSVIGGWRAFQSLYLARRDYSHLEYGLKDVAVFTMVLLFTSGAVVAALDENQSIILGVYAIFSLLALYNFWHLRGVRIPSDPSKLDVPVEVRIQSVNVYIFAVIALAMIVALVSVLPNRTPSTITFVATAITLPLFLINIVHSEQLSIFPKYCLTNRPDAPEHKVALYRSNFPRSSEGLDPKVIRSRIPEDAPESFQRIDTARARRADVDRLAKELLHDFAYIFEYIFATEDRRLLQETLIGLLQLAFGFGMFGYMHFYQLHLVSRKPSSLQRVGFIKLESRQMCSMYQLVESIAMPWLILRLHGPLKFWGIAKRARQVRLSQPPPMKGEVRLTYLHVDPAFRRRGIGLAVMRLLTTALVVQETKGLAAERITLFVRGANKAARDLFGRAGFMETPPRSATDDFGPLGLLVEMQFAEDSDA